MHSVKGFHSAGLTRAFVAEPPKSMAMVKSGSDFFAILICKNYSTLIVPPQTTVNIIQMDKHSSASLKSSSTQLLK
jgi:hypothetical protein